MYRRLDPVTGLMVMDGESVPSQVRNSITADIAEVNNKIQVFYPLGAAGTVPTSTGSGTIQWIAATGTGTVTNVTGTAPISVANGTTTPSITVATFGTSNSGVVPASGGGTTNFLRADGSWAAPPGGGGSGDVVGPASSTTNAIALYSDTTGKLIKNSVTTVDSNGMISADAFQFDTTPTTTSISTGTLLWDSGNNFLSIGLDGVTLRVGMQQYVAVYNDTASTMTKGQVVYVSGSSGTKIAVRLADASVEATSAGTLGLVANTISSGAEGLVQVSGPMFNLTTTGLTAGNLLFLSETAGQYTQTEPDAPAHGVRIGYVVRVHGSAGEIYIKIDNGYEIGELHNVVDSVTGATAFLVKNSSTNLWESKNASDSRDALGLGSLATQSGTFSGTSSGTNTGDVTLAGQSYLTLAGQQITAGQINLGTQVTGTLPITNGGTGATSAGAALTSLGAYPASNPNGYTSNAGTVTSVSGTAPVSVTNGTTTPAITVATFGTSNSGVVPASGGGTTNFLRADGTWAAPSGGGGISDGDKGDITVSASGATWTIDDDVVTYAKMQNVTTARLLGRASAGSGDCEEITLGNALSFAAGSLAVSGFLTGSLDNGALRADGNGGVTLQSSDLIIEDAVTTTTPNLALTNNHSGQTNSSFVLTPKGTGALIVGPRPDGTTTGGNARGARAVDFQWVRSNATNVASGAGAFLCGDNSASSGTGSVCFGSFTGSSGSYSFAAGNGNSASGTGAVAFGSSTTASSDRAFVHGFRAVANRLGMYSQASGFFASTGDAQRGALVARRSTTDATQSELTLDGGAPTGTAITTSNRIILLDNQAIMADVYVIARSASGTNHGCYHRRCLIQRTGTTTALVGTVQTVGTDIESAGASAWDVTLDADDTNESLRILVTGAASTTIRWLAEVQLREVIHA